MRNTEQARLAARSWGNLVAWASSLGGPPFFLLPSERDLLALIMVASWFLYASWLRILIEFLLSGAICLALVGATSSSIWVLGYHTAMPRGSWGPYVNGFNLSRLLNKICGAKFSDLVVPSKLQSHTVLISAAPSFNKLYDDSKLFVN